MEDVNEELCACLKDKIDTFSFLCLEDLKEISDFFKCRTVPAGNTLWREGDPCDYVAIIVSGRVKIQKETGLKGNHVVLGIYGEGTFVGELCILDDNPRTVTAVALDDTSLVLIMRESFEQLNTKYPELGGKLMKGMLLSVSKRLRGAFDRLVSTF